MSKQKIEIGIEDVLLTVQFNQFGWWVSSGGERILRMDDAETAAFCELQDRLWTAATACPGSRRRPVPGRHAAGGARHDDRSGS